MQSEDHEKWIEEQCMQSINAEPDYEIEYTSQMKTATNNVWASFQDSATSVAELYRERVRYSETAGDLWIPFQTAAGTVTTLYKDSVEGIKRTSDVAMICGYQKRSKEIANWARSKNRRYIRLDDLLSYIAGKPPPPIHINRRSPKPDPQLANEQPPNDLHTFKEAIAKKQRVPELYAFVSGEINRHGKRPASPLDVNMDVSNINNKRQRFM